MKLYIERESNQALVKDFEKLDDKTYIAGVNAKDAVRQEILNRTSHTLKILQENDIALTLRPEGWEVVDNYWDSPIVRKGEYPVDEQAHWLCQTTESQITRICLYEIAATIKRFQAIVPE